MIFQVMERDCFRLWVHYTRWLSWDTEEISQCFLVPANWNGKQGIPRTDQLVSTPTCRWTLLEYLQMTDNRLITIFAFTCGERIHCSIGRILNQKQSVLCKRPFRCHKTLAVRLNVGPTGVINGFRAFGGLSHPTEFVCLRVQTVGFSEPPHLQSQN